MAGTEALLNKAKQHLQNNEPIKTLHLLEVALAAEPANQQALTMRLKCWLALRHLRW